MDKITVDLRSHEIKNIDEAVDLVNQVKRKFPKVDSVIMSPSQEKVIGATDHELTEVRMKIGGFMGVPKGQIEYEIYKIKGIYVEVE